MNVIPAILAATLLASPALAADPVRIGVTTILSGPTADRGQSEQYGVELALQSVNEAGGVLGRPVEAIYGDNGADPAKGVAAVHRLIDEQHVPVMLGALATRVTHAIMPLVLAAKVPLVIDISGGQDFVDASGVGGNPYLFKTIPSGLDVARGMIAWIKPQPGHKLAILADDAPLSLSFAGDFAKAATDAGFDVADRETVPKGTTDMAPLLAKARSLGVDRLVLLLGPSTAPFFRAYAAAGWDVPVDGRIDMAAAAAAVPPAFLSAGGLAKVASIAVYTPLLDNPGIRQFVAAYQAKYGLAPTQRSFFAYESTLLVVDAIRRAKSDQAADITAALKTATMPSSLGGTYTMDDHNHPHTPLPITGIRDGKVAVIAAASST